MGFLSELAAGAAFFVTIAAGIVALAGILYTLTALVAIWRFGRQRKSQADSDRPLRQAEPITVLKPMKGVQPGLACALSTFTQQAYDAPVQLVHGVADPADPAVALVEQLAASAPATVTVALVVDGTRHGSNAKVSNLVNMWPHALHPVIVLADADIRVPPHWLTRVTSPLANPGVGLVTCLYRGIGTAGPVSWLAGMGIDWHFLPSVLVARMIGADSGCFGATIALHRATLERIGGLASLAGHLADDHELGRRVRALGQDVVIPPVIVDHLCDERQFAAALAHEIRWARTIRTINPRGHAGMVCTHPWPAAILFALLVPASVGVPIVLVAALVRLALAAVADHVLCQPRGRWPLILVRDLLSFFVFVTSFCGRSVKWRGQQYQVGGDGQLVESGGPEY